MIRDYRLYIEDILEALEKIKDYINGLTFSEFEQDNKTVDAVVRNFEILGEATKQIPDKIRNKYPDIPWKEMAGMRDKLIHAYFGVNLEVVWETMNKRLPKVKLMIEEVLEKMDQEAKNESE